MCTMYIHEPVCFRVWFFPFYKYFLYFPLPRFSPDSINVGPFNLQNNQSQYGKEKRKHTVPNRTSFLSPLLSLSYRFFKPHQYHSHHHLQGFPQPKLRFLPHSSAFMTEYLTQCVKKQHHPTLLFQVLFSFPSLSDPHFTFLTRIYCKYMFMFRFLQTLLIWVFLYFHLFIVYCFCFHDLVDVILMICFFGFILICFSLLNHGCV